MVTISIKQEKGAFELYANGHAEHAEYGKDLVCAAVSILLYTLVESIDRSDLNGEMIAVMQPGSTFIRMDPKKEKEAKIRGVLSVIETGFSLLEKNFPKNICFMGGVG